MQRSYMDRFIDAIEWIAAIFVGIVAADIFISVLLRYFFSTSIPDSYDLGRMLGIPHLLGHCGDQLPRHAHHRRPALFLGRPRAQRIMDVFATSVLLFVVSVQTYTLYDKVQQTRIDNVLTYDLNLPTWPAFALAWIGDVSAVLLVAIRTYRLIFHPEEMERGHPMSRKPRPMNPDLIAAGGFVLLFVLMLLRVPVGMAMALVGVGGYSMLVNSTAALKLIGQTSMRTVTDYTFGVIPMFLLMGAFVSTSGISKELFRAANTFLGHRRGGLGIATIAACGGFAAISGSSVATAATFSTVAYPEMRRFGYPQSFATGVIAAGGTLGAMLPPSTVLAVYAIITQRDIGKLFVAGVLPGLLAICIHMITIAIIARVRPVSARGAARDMGRARRGAEERLASLLLLFVFVIGGLYGGLFTPTEAGGMGAGGLHHRPGARPPVARRHPNIAAASDAHGGGRLHGPHRRASVRLFPHDHPDAAEGRHGIPDVSRSRPLRVLLLIMVMPHPRLPDGRHGHDHPDNCRSSSRRHASRLRSDLVRRHHRHDGRTRPHSSSPSA